MVSFSSDIFPTKTSFVVFISYMGLFINQGLLVTASKAKDNSYIYNTVTVVLFTEVLKLIVAILLFIKDHAIRQLFQDTVKHKKVLCLYFFPSALYCLYNNLQFINLAAYDPTTYYLLLQFRVVATGIIFQFVFKKQLSRLQWASLLILTLGCITKEMRYNALNVGTTSSTYSIYDYIDVHLVFVILQVFSSCFAGVYNEFLLKDIGIDVHIMLANVFMGLNSILCNILVMGMQGQLFEAFIHYNIDAILKPAVISLIINNAAIGLLTSIFLYSFNSILKVFASALELMLTAVLCWLLFDIPLDMLTVLAILTVSAAAFVYAQHPVVNRARADTDADCLRNGEIKCASLFQDSASGQRHKTLLFL